MQKRLFSLTLYREFLRQLRLPGLIFTVIMNIEAILIALSSVVMRYLSGKYLDGEETFSATSVTFLDIHPIAFCSFCIVAPVLMFCAFKWVNSRNSSDFYHSLCETRECIFLCSFAAAFSWVIISLLSSSVVAVLSTLIFPNFFILNMTSVFCNLITITSACLFVMAAVSIAISVTGTFFNNIIVSFIAAFFPQALFFAIRTGVIVNSPIMTDRGIFGQSYTIPFAIIEAIFNFGNTSAEDILGSIPHAIYTLVLAVIYIVIAVVLFKIRKSESAGNSAVGKKVQGLFRVLVGTTASLIPVTLLFTEIIGFNSEYGIDIDTLIGIIILYILMIVAVAVYELIATKKFRNLIPAAISLIPIAIVNVAVIGIMFGAYYIGISFKPDTNDIKSVQIVKSNWITDQYLSAVSDDIKISSVEAKEIVSTALKNSIGNQLNNDYSDSFESYTIAINTWSGTHYRNIQFTEKQYNALVAELESNKDYRELYLNLPKVNDGAVTVWSYHTTDVEIDGAKLYSLVRDDIASMKFYDAYHLLNRNNYENGTAATVSVTAPYGTKYYSMEVQVTEQTPSAWNYLIELYHKESVKNIDAIADYADEYATKIDSQEWKGIYFDVCFRNLIEADGTAFTEPVYPDDIDFNKLAEFIRNNKGKTVKSGQPYITVECNVESPVETEWGTEYESVLYDKLYIPLDSNELPDFYITSDWEKSQEK